MCNPSRPGELISPEGLMKSLLGRYTTVQFALTLLSY